MAITAQVLLIASEIRRRMLDLTNGQVVALTQAWVTAWDTLGPDLEDVLAEILAAGEGAVSAATLARSRQLTAALAQAKVTLEQLTGTTVDVVSSGLSTAVDLAVEGHMSSLAAQLPPTAAAVGITFSQPATDALAAIVARTTQQIHSSAIPLADNVVRSMKRSLIRGIAIGDNPRTTARRIVREVEGNFNGGLARATNIARTETLDAHRAGARAAALRNEELLTGWVWSATLDSRTCPACLVNHGSEHPVSEDGPLDHQQGRCARIDQAKSWKELGFDLEEPPNEMPSAKDWFDNLTPDTKSRILGPARYEMLKNGDVRWEDLATKVSNSGWRDSIATTSVKDLRTKIGG